MLFLSLNKKIRLGKAHEKMCNNEIPMDGALCRISFHWYSILSICAYTLLYSLFGEVKCKIHNLLLSSNLNYDYHTQVYCIEKAITEIATIIIKIIIPQHSEIPGRIERNNT